MEQPTQVSLLRADDDTSDLTSNQNRVNELFRQRCLLLPGVLHLEQAGGGFGEPDLFRVSVANEDAERAIYRLQAELFKKFPGVLLVAEIEPQSAAA